MFCRSHSCMSRRFRYNTKYPSLVSYNKLPWEILNHETPDFHMHVAPHYEQIFTLAASVQIPNFVSKGHQEILPEYRLRLLPGMLYALDGDAMPVGFTVHRVSDPTSLQYYGRLGATVAHVLSVRMLVSDDLRLLCNTVTLQGPLRLPLSPHGALTLLKGTTGAKNAPFTLYHYFRPNRPPSELHLEKYYIHAPRAMALEEFASTTNNTWEPRLQAPKRAKRVTPLPVYCPPKSYLMGLAERLAVVPGSCFGRRSLMWGHWF